MELILPSFCFVVGTSRHAPSQKSFRVSAEPPPGATVHRPAHGGVNLKPYSAGATGRARVLHPDLL